MIDRIEGMLLNAGRSEALTNLKRYAETVKIGLERVDEGLFRRLRQNIAGGDYTSEQLKQQIAEYACGPRAVKVG